MQSDRKGGFIQPRCLTRPSLPLPLPPLCCWLPSQTTGRNYVRRDHTSPLQLRPHPVRYVTGPSTAISNCCHHLFSSPFPSCFDSPRTSAYSHGRSRSRYHQSFSMDEEKILSALIVSGLQIMAAHVLLCHPRSVRRCFIPKRNTCWQVSLADQWQPE